MSGISSFDLIAARIAYGSLSSLDALRLNDELT
jgi:hypothetical protein